MDDIKRRPGRNSKDTAVESSDEAVYQKTPEQFKKTKEQFDRVYAKTQILDHDLYKLEPTALKRNAGYNPDQPVWENVEHVHFFHTIDSRGKPQEFTNKVSGHYHRVTVDQNGHAKCSEPLREVTIKRNGRIIRQAMPVPYDTHLHEVTYRFSERIKPQIPNIEFAKLQVAVVGDQTSALSQSIPDVRDNDLD